MAPLPSLPQTRLGVFTAAEAHACGWTPDALERAERTRRLIRLRRGVYAVPGDDGDLHPSDVARRDRTRRSIAAALANRDSTVTGLSVATLFGWPVWAPREVACLTITSSAITCVDGIHLHRGGIRDAARATVAGFRLTRPTRTVVDIAREHGTEAGLVVADAAMRAGLTSPARLRAEVDRLIGRRGVGHARPLCDLVDPLSESVLESRSRWQFVVHDLPAPRSQMWIYDLEGNFLGRSDFLWEVGVVGEVDGGEKLIDPAARAAYLRRQHLLDRVHLRKARWGARDLPAFGATAAWIREELAGAEADVRPRLWVARPARLGVQTAGQAVGAAVWAPSRR